MWQRTETGWTLVVPWRADLELRWVAYLAGSWLEVRVGRRGRLIATIKAGEA